ncbi:MerR family transcriptional regulator [Hymenobacter lutimineralis]|uniref:MerR family transcriptional regulator n=1 Tax=Hymenobacter lutimineralis TaxID=2606448 RepID=A0A5D6UV54_9BACT|nr:MULTISPECIES: MerR family transcriptional regulator [Hymenobacter]QIX62765.1 MerR family transcriptional regulator [Hymenobacter sp. BT18]TYZ07621.1 MerR family transcriptional regulator [Hymenobacter lutimineralis]
MGRFSISDLEQLSGIKAHTIRMWEQRYGILQPVRTATNIRTYCDEDLRRLLNVATLCARGQRISRIAQLAPEELSRAVISCCDDAHDYFQQVNSLLAAMLAMDERRLCCLLDTAIQELGFEEAIMRVAYPFLQRIGVMWQAGSVNPAQEHLVTNLLRQKMMAGIDALPPVQPQEARRWVLFLPEGEMHELALLFMSYVLRARKQHVLYLGQNLPTTELGPVCETYQPHAVCTVMTAMPERDRVQAFVEQVHHLCPGVMVYLYGPLAQQEGLRLPANTVRVRLMTDFLALASSLCTCPEAASVA